MVVGMDVSRDLREGEEAGHEAGLTGGFGFVLINLLGTHENESAKP